MCLQKMEKCEKIEYSLKEELKLEMEHLVPSLAIDIKITLTFYICFKLLSYFRAQFETLLI